MLKRILIAGALCAGVALAQGGYGGGGGGRGRQGGGDMGARGGGMSSMNRFDIISNALDLNKDQKNTVHTILEEGAKEAAPLREQISKSRVAVGEAIVANKSEDELKQVAKATSDLDAQLSEIELKMFAKTFAELDAEQKKNMQGLVRALVLMNGMYHTKNWTDL